MMFRSRTRSCRRVNLLVERIHDRQAVDPVIQGTCRDNNAGVVTQRLRIQEARVRVFCEQQIAERFQLFSADIVGEGRVFIRVPNLLCAGWNL